MKQSGEALKMMYTVYKIAQQICMTRLWKRKLKKSLTCVVDGALSPRSQHTLH